MNSRIYSGFIGHCRHMPVINHFRYKLFMLYLDLDELDSLFDKFLLWSAKSANFAWFKRSDHLGDPSQSLGESVRDLVAEKTGSRPTGPIRLLTNLRYFFYKSNPVSFYYCFEPDGRTVHSIVAEVTNTPWGEMYCYVLGSDQLITSTEAGDDHLFYSTDKVFTVSPFMPLDMEYGFEFSLPKQNLLVKMQNFRRGERVFDVSLNLDAQPITRASLAKQLVSIPLISVKVTAGIYWQAIKIWLKGVPFLGHAHEKINNKET
ncbi:MAG: DUF1365 domain-containing protein [Porticoccaceae bacterium]